MDRIFSIFRTVVFSGNVTPDVVKTTCDRAGGSTGERLGAGTFQRWAPRTLPLLDLTFREVLVDPFNVKEIRIPSRRKCSRRLWEIQLTRHFIISKTGVQYMGRALYF
jgi:hypothetical protein